MERKIIRPNTGNESKIDWVFPENEFWLLNHCLTFQIYKVSNVGKWQSKPSLESALLTGFFCHYLPYGEACLWLEIFKFSLERAKKSINSASACHSLISWIFVRNCQKKTFPPHFPFRHERKRTKKNSLNYVNFLSSDFFFLFLCRIRSNFVPTHRHSRQLGRLLSVLSISVMFFILQ